MFNIDRIILNNKIKFNNTNLSDIPLSYIFDKLDYIINTIKINRADINEEYNPSYILHNIRLNYIHIKFMLIKIAFDNIIDDIILRL